MNPSLWHCLIAPVRASKPQPIAGRGGTDFGAAYRSNTLKRLTMKYLKIYRALWLLMSAGFVLNFFSCKDDDDQPFNDRVLQVFSQQINGADVANGQDAVSRDISLEVIFSHELKTADIESALSFANGGSAVPYSLAFSNTNSTITLTPSSRLEYATTYTLTLAAGAYGIGGQTLEEDLSLSFTTEEFVPPVISLSADKSSFFEGEMITLTASLDKPAETEVTADLAFTGSAIKDEDYSVSASSISIGVGQTETTFTIEATEGDAIEGEEDIVIMLQNLTVAVEDPTVEVTLSLGDRAPSLELRGVMELDNYIDGSGGRVRAIHLNVLKDIPDLSVYGVEIASNGAAPDPNDIDFTFPAQAASAGDQLFVVRDQDAALAATYFGGCYGSFTEFPSDAITQNGDDAILLYNNGVAIESFGEPGVDGTGMEWEYTDSWAYKFGDEWVYAGVDCVENAVGEATDATSACPYPFCANALQLQGMMSLKIAGTGTNGRAIHLRANMDIADLSIYQIGIANNGGGSDGPEITFPAISVSPGEHILFVRDIDVDNINTYFGSCTSKWAHIIPNPAGDDINFNGDDPVELFENGAMIETYGDVALDGTGELWEYTGSWAFKAPGGWTYGGVDCQEGANTNAEAGCPYPFCD